MNLRFAAYATAAVLIGFAVMMLPLALETTSPTSHLNPNNYNVYPDGKNTSEQRNQTDNAYALTQHSPITTTTLILMIGLIIALTAYILVKKQINPPPYQKTYKPF